MKYLFILGRNPKLSIAEVVSYFERDNNPILNYQANKNSILIEVNEEIEKGIIDKFGGVIAIGEVISSGEIEEITTELAAKELYLGESNKFNYVVWNFSEKSNEISDYLKYRFKSEKLKSTEKRLTGLMNLQGGERVPMIASSLINEQYFLFSGREKEYFGKIVESCNYEEIEKRDMGKPVRRELLSISPRLAKIMINLSQVPKGGKLVDPFCGIGVILQEALLQEIEVVGVDNDKEAIEGAHQNLEWFNFKKEDYTLVKNDSSKIKVSKADVVVTEPDLGEVLRKQPTKEKAFKIKERFEHLMVDVLNNMKNGISGKIVFTSPLIQLGKKRVSCNIKNILDYTNLKLVKGFPIQEFRENQVVGREIFVIEK